MGDAEVDMLGDEGGATDDRTRTKGQLSGRAAKWIRERIYSGSYAPGERLRENVICDELGMSRTPIREAFRTLASEGLITQLPNRSVVVAEFDAEAIGPLFETFGALESLAGELACARITDSEILEIAKLQHDMVDYFKKGDRLNYSHLNQAIHRKIMAIANNPVLESLWDQLLPRMKRARSLPNLDRERWEEAVEEHNRMFAALAARDGRLLNDVMRKHFQNGLERYLSARQIK